MPRFLVESGFQFVIVDNAPDVYQAALEASKTIFPKEGSGRFADFLVYQVEPQPRQVTVEREFRIPEE